ncbi:MAG: HNH endonuclease signature motif containing protein, partial [Bacteroidota bacterium]
KVKSSDNKSIAAYRFGDPDNAQLTKIPGRRHFSKLIKKDLFNENPDRCSICNGLFEERYLQVDHRIPYEIGVDDNQHDRKQIDYMLLCRSCNRAKSWSCEHCENWKKIKDSSSCLHCYWGAPLNYNHISKLEIRRLDIVWENEEVNYFEKLKKLAIKQKLLLPDFV